MSESKFSLIDLGKLSEPAVELIRAVRSATGILFEPTRIRREAGAKAYAKIIMAEASAKEQEIAFRASERLSYREIRRQKNIEAVTAGAVDIVESGFVGIEGPQNNSDTSGTDRKQIEEDWVYKFFDYCHDVGDSEMQILWSKILAGEFQTPGRFSIRVLNTVSILTKEDAELFTRLCGLVWKTDRGNRIFDLWNTELRCMLKSGHEINAMGVGDEYTLWDINHDDFRHLKNLGLLDPDAEGISPTGSFVAAYSGNFYRFDGGRHSGVGFHCLTDIGEALYPISGFSQLENYRERIIETISRGTRAKEISADEFTKACTQLDAG